MSEFSPALNFPDENLTFVIQHRIKASQQNRYEAWLKKIVPFAASYPGHRGVHIIRPAPGNSDYVIVIRFSDLASAKNWIESKARRDLLAEIEDAFRAAEGTELKSGIDFWFTPPSEKKPPAWKQWLVTTAIITPLAMLVPFLLRPLFTSVPALAAFGVGHLITTSVIVALVTFFLMPRAVNLLRPWLFKAG